MKRRKRLIVCITTYERADIVQEFLDMYYLNYKSMGIDLVIYDSSVSDKTEQICTNTPFFDSKKEYCRLDSSIHSNVKFIKILENPHLAREYDYVWICQEALACSSTGLKRIVGRLDSHNDLIHIGCGLIPLCDEKEYMNAQTYFSELAWHATLYGAVILRTDSFLNKVSWDDVESKCLQDEKLSYSQISFYFNRINDLNSFHAIYLDLGTGNLIESKKKKKPGWYANTFKVLCEDWINTIDALPDNYRDKAEVIRQLPKNAMLQNEMDLMGFKLDNAYNMDIYQSYRERLKRLLPFSDGCLKQIAGAEKEDIYYIVRDLDAEYLKPLQSQVGKRKDIYLYGAGVYGDVVFQLLEDYGYSVKGFIVTQKRMDRYLGCPVYAWKEIRNDVVVVLTVGKRYFDEIKKNLQKTMKQELLIADIELNIYAKSRKRVLKQLETYEKSCLS